jgi:hypothetical protein
MRSSAPIRQDHIQTVGEQWEILSQCIILRPSSKTAYRLRAGDGRYGVSARLYNNSARSHTDCWQAMGDTGSVGDSAAIQQGHLLPRQSQ